MILLQAILVDAAKDRWHFRIDSPQGSFVVTEAEEAEAKLITLGVQKPKSLVAQCELRVR